MQSYTSAVSGALSQRLDRERLGLHIYRSVQAGKEQAVVKVQDVKESITYHDREYDSSHSGLEDPEEGQAHHLQEGEEVDPAQRDVAQVDKVRLVF